MCFQKSPGSLKKFLFKPALRTKTHSLWKRQDLRKDTLNLLPPIPAHCSGTVLHSWSKCPILYHFSVFAISWYQYLYLMLSGNVSYCGSLMILPCCMFFFLGSEKDFFVSSWFKMYSFLAFHFSFKPSICNNENVSGR